MNRSRTACLVVLSTALLAGCGGGSDGTTVAPPPPPAAGPSTSSPAPSTDSSDDGASSAAQPTASSAADAAAAKAALLLAADMPGFEGDPNERDDAADADEKALYECIGASRPAYAQREEGAMWSKGRQEVVSSADLLPSAVAAQSDAAAAQSAPAAACFGKYLLSYYGEDGGETTTGELVPVDVAGADQAFGVRVTMKSPDGEFNVSGFFVGAYVDSVRINLTSVEINGQAPDLAQTVELARKAAERVRAASGA